MDEAPPLQQNLDKKGDWNIDMDMDMQTQTPVVN